MKILILTGKFGMGHYSASVSLAQQIAKRYSNTSIEIKDIFEYTMPNQSNKIYKAFNFMVNNGSRFYNQYYKMTENTKQDLRPVFLNFFLNKISRLILEEEPTIIISTLPLCSQIISRYKKRYHSNIPLITCVTDLSSHSEWINKETDAYLVGSREIKNRLIQKGVSANKIYVNGIPVKLEFRMDVPKKKSSMKHILIMGGGLGILPKSEEFYQQLNHMENVLTTVITGNNKKLYEELHGKYDNIEVIGYTEEVYKYMQKADVVLSKPGGITMFETIQSETPFLVFQPFLQQEINNSNFIMNHNIGKILDEVSCVDTIKTVIYDETLLKKMKNNVKAVKKQCDITSIEKILFQLEVKAGGVCA